MRIIPAFDVNQNIDQTNYYWFENAFDKQELEWIDNLKELYPFEKATTVGGEETTDLARKSEIKWMNCDDNSWWVYNKLTELVQEANKAMWNFNLHTIIDSIQYTEYYEGGGHYGWHVDIGPGSINHRKISITVQLSDGDDYEGGDFEIWSGGDFKTCPRKKGCTIMFPSFLLHRVTPVTKGIRRSLVLWVGGDTYK